jgi:hypothetical protein
MMLEAGRWRIACDPATTVSCYSSLPVGVDCSCAGCRNFMAAIDRAFPSEFRAIARGLGVDLAKPAELVHYGRETAGLHLSGGWFHSIGTVLQGADAWTAVGPESWTGALEQLVPGFEFGFTSRLALVREPFLQHSTLQLEFMTRVPWVLSEAETPGEGGLGCPTRRRSR